MSSDIERFINLINMTDYMKSLIFSEKENVEKYKDVIELLEWNKYKDVQEIIKLNNEHINNAIKEVLSNEKFIEIIKEDTNINIEDIRI